MTAALLRGVGAGAQVLLWLDVLGSLVMSEQFCGQREVLSGPPFLAL